MSTSLSDARSQIGARGNGSFDAVALRNKLAELDHGAYLEPSHLADYLTYYGLRFAEVTYTHKLIALDLPTERIIAQHFIPAEAQGHVLLCHGYYDHVGLYGYVIEYLLQQNLAVVTYDQIGHGLSTGTPATIDNFDRYIEANDVVYQHAREMLTPDDSVAWHWFGQSMGGGVVMDYLQQHPPANGVGEIVLFAPLVRPYAWWINRWIFAIAKLTIVERPRTLTNNAENPEFHALQEVDPLQARVLPVAWVQAMVNWYKRFEQYPMSELAPKIIQGDNDRTVDQHYNLKLYAQRYPQAQFFIIPGGRHHLANESPTIRQAIWNYLTTNCTW